MAPIWPFNRKKTGVPKAKPTEEKKVVSYEREQGDAQKEKLEDRTHLEIPAWGSCSTSSSSLVTKWTA